MLPRLIEFSLRQRALVLIAAGVLAAAGVWAYLNLPIDAFPDISPTQVKVVLKVPGMTPEEVEQYTRWKAPPFHGARQFESVGSRLMMTEAGLTTVVQARMGLEPRQVHPSQRSDRDHG